MQRLRNFGANHEQRRTLMWVLVAVGVLVVIFGIYQIVTGQLDYMDYNDKIEDAELQVKNFESLFPTVEDENGELKVDLTEASQDDLMVLAMLNRDVTNLRNDRVDPDNQRRTGVRIVGIGVLVLAVAYLLLPENKQAALADDETPARDTPDDSL